MSCERDRHYDYVSSSSCFRVLHPNNRSCCPQYLMRTGCSILCLLLLSRPNDYLLTGLRQSQSNAKPLIARASYYRYRTFCHVPAPYVRSSCLCVQFIDLSSCGSGTGQPYSDFLGFMFFERWFVEPFAVHRLSGAHCKHVQVATSGVANLNRSHLS